MSVMVPAYQASIAAALATVEILNALDRNEARLDDAEAALARAWEQKSDSFATIRGLVSRISYFQSLRIFPIGFGDATLDRLDDLLEKASRSRHDHWNEFIEIPPDLVEIVLPYIDDAEDLLVENFDSEDMAVLASEGMSVDDLRRSLPKFEPAVSYPDYFKGPCLGSL